MKVKMQLGNSPLSGKAGELVYCYNRRTGKMYARTYAYPKLTANNHKMGSVSKNLFGIEPSSGFRYDCRTYAFNFASTKKGSQVKIWTWSNTYTHLMYALAAAMPDVDLSTLSRDEIYLRDLPCISIKRAVEAGLLTPVKDYDRLDNMI